MALAVACLLFPCYAASQDQSAVAVALAPTPASATENRAVCEIVYQVDDGVPGPRGLRYLFFGNGFFINKDGYLLTAAHVLSQLHGGQPYVLIHDEEGQPQFVRADVVALDPDHEVAILRATPNPFSGDRTLSFLALSPEAPTTGEMVHAASLSPAKPLDAYSLDPVLDERSPGGILRYEFSEIDKGAAESQLFLFNHSIRPGQSGSPVIDDRSQGVAGIVEGEWLRDDSYWLAALKNDPSAATTEWRSGKSVAALPGAAVPIHYAIALLQKNGIPWQPAWVATTSAGGSLPDVSTAGAAANASGSSLATPLSLVPAPYPAQSLFGGEVLLDALVGRNGTLSDIRVVHGDEPFLQSALEAVSSWTFHPAQSSGQTVDSRISIAFQFPQPYVPPRKPTSHNYADKAKLDDGAFPITTVEAEYPVASNEQGSVILYETVDAQGQPSSIKSILGADALTAPAIAAVKQWHFASGTQSGAQVESAAIVVVTFRRPLTTPISMETPSQLSSSTRTSLESYTNSR
jgi:TonB family protein